MSLFSSHPTILVVLVHNRQHNLKLWLNAWKKCLKAETKIVVIHNHDGSRPPKRFEELCSEYGADYYYPRRNTGFDIGAFQDFVTGNLSLLVEWELLFWCVDDTIPLRIDFIPSFRNIALQPGVGAVGAHISDEYQRHLRTNAFMIRRSVAELLRFPSNKVSTKNDCYDFEHRSHNMLIQIESTGMKVKQASINVNEYFWDMGFSSTVDLMETYRKTFGKV